MSDRERLQKLIEDEAEKFFDFPTDRRDYVTTLSAKLFAEHMINKSKDPMQFWGLAEGVEFHE